ncbi:tripartite tricarboxylate transporter permease [Thermanaerosceptrum fracticalcis]|uniref:tripartite tricarboxylate transporter permease n=1 Tax=Thermanaerosceptrum fracticalcis TaxID=1712410 RepID=UPI000A40BEBD|nr:tripartite tricarboxylate transporter permease [Thermanaerosceptrum fracticalcis]
MIENVNTIISLVFTVENILMTFLGVLGGIIIGALPGLTGTMAVALLVPFTFGMDSTSAISMLLGVYCGSTYGGSIAAILVKIPGTAAAIMTTCDGYPMAQRGEAGRAIGISTVASTIGGILSIFVLLFAAPQLAKIAIDFGSPEYFALAVFGLSVIASVSDGSLIKGLMSAVIGILISLIGFDGITGTPRFTFGFDQLNGGIAFIPLMIGLYGMSELLSQVGTITEKRPAIQIISHILPSLKDIKRILKTTLKGTGIGVLIGALPGAGATIAAILSYSEAKRSSKIPESFGTGIPEGIAAPESANNAVTGGALIPMLTLGIPGDGVTAILIGAFMLHNLTPGPLLITQQPTLIGSLFVTLLIANIFMLIIGLFGARVFAKLISMSPTILVPILFVFSFIGSYAVNLNLLDIKVVLVLGLMGFVLQKLEFPIGPVVLGFILGPIAEVHLRQALMLSQLDVSILFSTTITKIIWILTIISLFSKQMIRLINVIINKTKLENTSLNNS